MIERIAHKGTELGLIIRRSFSSDHTEFFTPSDYSQQLGYMKHARGHVIPAHVHNPVTREVHFTREVLIIKSGRVRVDLYTEEQSYVESVILAEGDVILLASGGHGFEMLETTEMIEIKQGPYAGDDDKTRFATVGADDIVVREESR